MIAEKYGVILELELSAIIFTEIDRTKAIKSKQKHNYIAIIIEFYN